jgi:uncharacterized SAM-binding protein YcdF (DUF218 family)
MFFVLSKILALFISPLFWVLLCLALGYFLKNAKLKKRFYIASLSLFLFFSNGFIFDEFMRAYEPDGVKYNDVAYHDVAIVLGGMAYYNNDLDRLNFGWGSDRIFQALYLYKQGKVGKILISGDSGALGDDGLDEAKQVKQYLVDLGFNSEDILTETKSKNTYENAAFSTKIIRSDPSLKSYLLVTSGYHMPRAKACFKKQGLKVTPFPVDLFTGARYFSLRKLFIPSIETMNNWHILTHEWMGYIAYKFAGYL